MNFSIEAYLDSLNNDVTSINISGRRLTYLPDLSRFKKLQILLCHDNQLISLPKLPNSLRELYCVSNQLTSLPSLPDNLTNLECNYNQLTALPILPNSLRELYCDNNQLTFLPKLPNNLKGLDCGSNQLTSLPDLPESLEWFNFHNNPIYSIVFHKNIEIIKLNIKKLNNFRALYYALRFRNRFRRWLWEGVRKPKIDAYYHPANLVKRLLEEDGDLDRALDYW